MFESRFTGAPSKANPGVAIGMAPKIRAKMIRSDVRITQLLVRPAGVGYSSGYRRTNLLGVLPQRTRRMVSRARPPFGLALGQFRLSQLYVKDPGDRVDLDDVAVLEQRNRTANGSFRPDMADAEAARCARKTAVGDEGDLAARPLAGQRCGRRKHFTHSGTAARSFVADDEDLAFLVRLLFNRFEGILFVIEAAGWT